VFLGGFFSVVRFATGPETWVGGGGKTEKRSRAFFSYRLENTRENGDGSRRVPHAKWRETQGTTVPGGKIQSKDWQSSGVAGGGSSPNKKRPTVSTKTERGSTAGLSHWWDRTLGQRKG